jgi:hypothetical protein
MPNAPLARRWAAAPLKEAPLKFVRCNAKILLLLVSLMTDEVTI